MTPAPDPAFVQERRGVLGGAGAALATSIIVLGLALVLLPGRFEFPIDPAERWLFAIRADVIAALWLVVAVGRVANGRFGSSHDIGADAPPSPALARRLAFLGNTLEQVVLAVLAWTGLTTLDGAAPLAWIVGAAVLFCVGRAAFLAGHGRGAAARAFGFGLTFYPTVAALLWTTAATAARLFGIG